MVRWRTCTAIRTWVLMGQRRGSVAGTGRVRRRRDRFGQRVLGRAGSSAMGHGQLGNGEFETRASPGRCSMALLEMFLVEHERRDGARRLPQGPDDGFRAGRRDGRGRSGCTRSPGRAASRCPIPGGCRPRWWMAGGADPLPNEIPLRLPARSRFGGRGLCLEAAGAQVSSLSRI